MKNQKDVVARLALAVLLVFIFFMLICIFAGSAKAQTDCYWSGEFNCTNTNTWSGTLPENITIQGNSCLRYVGGANDTAIIPASVSYPSWDYMGFISWNGSFQWVKSHINCVSANGSGVNRIITNCDARFSKITMNENDTFYNPAGKYLRIDLLNATGEGNAIMLANSLDSVTIEGNVLRNGESFKGVSVIGCDYLILTLPESPQHGQYNPAQSNRYEVFTLLSQKLIEAYCTELELRRLLQAGKLYMVVANRGKSNKKNFSIIKYK